MSRDELPEKCCAKCGFLYGVFKGKESDWVVGGEDAVFDPDIVRTAMDEDSHPKDVTSKPFEARYARSEKAQGLNVVKRILPYKWEELGELRCLRRSYGPWKGDWQAIRQAVSLDRGDLKSDEGCASFFEYQPGFTAPQHTELMLEEQRIERQERHERAIADLQAMYAARLNFATWALVIVTAVLVVVTLYDNWPDILAWIASLASYAFS